MVEVTLKLLNEYQQKLIDELEHFSMLYVMHKNLQSELYNIETQLLSGFQNVKRG